MEAKSNLALFDLDGTLFDTGDVNYYAYKDALKEFGIAIDKDHFIKECNGRHYTEFLPTIMGKKGTLENIEAVHAAKKANYAGNLSKAKPNVHLFEIIKSIKKKYYLAIVTTASRRNTNDILEYYGYTDLFEYIITQEDVSKVKPDPQGFFMAMDKFGLDSKHTIIFEDSESGIQAALATGASVFTVKSLK